MRGMRLVWILGLLSSSLVACGDDEGAPNDGSHAGDGDGDGDRDAGGGDGDGDGDAQDGGELSDAASSDASEAELPPPEAFDEGGCTATGLAQGEPTTIEVEHEGMTRKYVLYVPDSVDLEAPTPLVLNFHGLTSSASAQQLYAGTAISDERGFIVAFPEGLGNAGGQSFNAGVCCSDLGTPAHMADDADFARAVVADIAERVCVDRRRVYSTGMSNGGYMSEWNACQNADLFAAVAPVSALGFSQADCDPARPISMIAFNGTDDGLVSYRVSQQTVEAWRERNGCSEAVTREDYGDSYCDTWRQCEAGVQVTACTVTGMQHCWPGNPMVLPGFCTSGGLDDIDANTMMYDFFERFALP